MKAKLFEHLLSIVVVTGVLAALAVAVRHGETSRAEERTRAAGPYIHLEFLDLNDPAQRALLHETLDAFYPDSSARNDSLMGAIEAFRQEQFSQSAFKTGEETGHLTGARVAGLAGMYLQFMLVYLVVMFLTYHAAHSLAILRFVALKQNRPWYLPRGVVVKGGEERRLKPAPTGERDLPGSAVKDMDTPPATKGVSPIMRNVIIAGMTIARFAAYAVLFAPAYVIGYSIKSTFDSSSILFLVGLAVLTNGLLINYANKFFLFLASESRRGYVDTAIVKNISASYSWGSEDGIPWRAVLRPKRLLPPHVFRHIYLNARNQFLPSLKEHASFLITGLIIIEMALNIQGQLGYELLQTILYKQYMISLAIIAGIFLTVKGTEIAVDIWSYAEGRKYENR